MKTFKEEYCELIEWKMSESKKIEHLSTGLTLDGEHALKERKLGAIFRQKTRELMKKHNMR